MENETSFMITLELVIIALIGIMIYMLGQNMLYLKFV